MTKISWWVWGGLLAAMALGGCSRESDGRGVVMVPPEEGAGGEAETTLRRPASRTIGGSAEPQVAGWQLEAARLHERAVEEADAFAQALAADRCPSAEELRNRICDLAARICEIAELHPTDEATAQRCADADARCTRASERVAERCEY